MGAGSGDPRTIDAYLSPSTALSASVCAKPQSAKERAMATMVDRTTDIPLVEAVVEKFQYPGVPTTCDGAEAVVWVETRISQGCGAFPITSSTTMGGGFNQAVVNGVPNLWGDQLVFVEPESEHSSASFCEGFAAAGG